jgi:hypothetical protein
LASTWSEEGLAPYGRPEIFNTAQGSQFTSGAFTGLLLENRSLSAWTAAGLGGTMSLSSGYGGRSNMTWFTCGLTTLASLGRYLVFYDALRSTGQSGEPFSGDEAGEEVCQRRREIPQNRRAKIPHFILRQPRHKPRGPCAVVRGASAV